MLQRLLTILSLVSVISGGCGTAHAQVASVPTCLEVISSCNKALEARKEQVRLSDLALKDVTTQKTALETELKQERSKNESLLRNPWLYFALGVIGGVWATR